MSSDNKLYFTILISVVVSVLLTLSLIFLVPSIRTSLQGPIGPMGIRGIKGEQGETGSQGSFPLDVEW